jgi:Family of unknown function (DUF6263)
MSMRVTAGAGLLLLAVVLPAPAQTALEWKFKAGDKFYIENVTKTQQKITVGDKTTESDSTFTTVSRFEVKKADAGSYTLEQTIEGVQVKSSKADDPTTPIASRFANLLKGATFKFTINAAGKVTSGLEGYDDLIKKLSGNNESAEKENRSRLPEDVFKEDLNTIFGFLPEKPVQKDDTWVRKESMILRWGKLTGEASYKYKGPSKDGEQIDVSRKWTYALTGEGDAGVKVTKGELKADEPSAAVIIADLAAGRLVSSTQTTHLSGKFTTTDAMMKDTSYTVDQTTTRTIKRVDKNPLEK